MMVYMMEATPFDPSMTADVNGTWIAEKEGDLNGTYYTYLVSVGGNENAPSAAAGFCSVRADPCR